ncbi:unnamed protein product, partial [Iphiclides podalirius]
METRGGGQVHNSTCSDEAADAFAQDTTRRSNLMCRAVAKERCQPWTIPARPRPHKSVGVREIDEALSTGDTLLPQELDCGFYG